MKCANVAFFVEPRIGFEFGFDMVFCFGIRLAPYAVFFTRIYLQHIARPVKNDHFYDDDFTNKERTYFGIL